MYSRIWQPRDKQYQRRVGNIPYYYCHVLKLLWRMSVCLVWQNIPCRESSHMYTRLRPRNVEQN